MIEFFDRIEIVNKDLQMSELCVIEPYRSKLSVFSLEAFHDSRFEVIWQRPCDCINDLDIKDPKLPQRKISKRLKSNNEFGKNHVFQSPQDMY